MLRISRALAAALFAAALAPALAQEAQFSREAQDVVGWVKRTRDHRGLPFAVVDKAGARIHVFDAAGRWRASSAVLIGQTAGDEIAPGVGQLAQQGAVPVSMRTTPAGRFVTSPGRNLEGEHVVWVDYESAFAIHRLRPGRSYKARAERLASPSVEDNRASLGCVIVPVPFYTTVVQPLLGEGRAVVYVMPENSSLSALLGQ